VFYLNVSSLPKSVSAIGCADAGGASIESHIDALRSSAHPIIVPDNENMSGDDKANERTDALKHLTFSYNQQKIMR
jgi:hypothetical protein